jgi:hypothetical protein
MAKPTAPISSRDLGNDNYLPGLLDQIMSDFLKQRIDDSLPAIVISFDSEKNRVTVQPLIRMLQSDGTEVSRGTLSVPVFSYGTGQMSLRFNLSAGDLGWIKANDRDISLFLQSLKEEGPNTLRRHDFSDALFYPDAMRGMSFTADAIMSNKSGTVKTEWFQDKIVHTASEVVIDSLLATFTGDIKVEGGISAADDITTDSDVLCDNLEAETEVSAGVGAGKVTLTGHSHKYVAPEIPSTVQPGTTTTGAG